MELKNEKVERPGYLYWIFKAYLRFFHDKIYYKKTYKVNSEAIPKNHNIQKESAPLSIPCSTAHNPDTAWSHKFSALLLL